MVHIDIRNESRRKRFYRRDNLQRLAERVCREEGACDDTRYSGLELSVLFCDDPFITTLNEEYRKKPVPTDVLSFAQEDTLLHGERVLGDIVISLETVERYCKGDSQAMRDEVRLLFCHGLLHLLGYTHVSDAEREIMNEKQAQYLNTSKEAAWRLRA